MKLNRDTLIKDLADSACESIDIKDLIEFYYNNQVEYMYDLSDNELVEHAEDFGGINEDEINEDYTIVKSK